jgi:hypothetical protein
MMGGTVGDRVEVADDRVGVVVDVLDDGAYIVDFGSKFDRGTQEVVEPAEVVQNRCDRRAWERYVAENEDTIDRL